jgi:DNA repair exonuclease SbcCD ATPase subunit
MEAVMAEQTVVNKDSGADQWLDRTLDEVFLSPRVIDERSYEELAGSLRALMKDAAGQSRALAGTTAEVKLLGDQLREATAQLKAKVETAARVIPTLDQRVAKAEALLEVTGKELAGKVAAMQEAAARAVPIERERIAAQLRAEAGRLHEEVISEQVRLLRERLESELETARKQAAEQSGAIMSLIAGAQSELEKSINAFEERSWALTKKVEEGLARLEELTARVTEACARAEAAHEKLDGLAGRAESAQSALESTVTEAGVRLGAGMSEAERRAETIIARANAATEALAAKIEEARPVRELVMNVPDEETLKSLGLWLQQLIVKGDQIGRGLDALLRRAEG